MGIAKTLPQPKAQNIERLYGVVHGGHIECALIIAPILVTLKPSPRLIQELSGLQRGTTIGIEDLHPEHRKVYDAKILENGLGRNKHDQNYWDSIIKVLQDRQLSILYLDKISQYDNIIKLQRETNKVTNALMKPLSRTDARRLTAERYALEIEIQYDLSFRRHDQLVKAIKDAKPEVVVIGEGHASRMWAEAQAGKLNGIQIRSYSAEKFPDMSRAMSNFALGLSSFKTIDEMGDWLSGHIDPNGFVQNPQNSESSGKLEQVRYKAVSEGRVTDAIPSYIGTFDHYVPERGLFEMFIRDRKPNGKGSDEISGTIEDTFGSSTFTGIISEGRITFEKRYCHEAVKAGGFDEYIFYSGSIRNGSVFGLFETASGHSSNFRMYEFDPNKKMYGLRRN